MARVCTYTLKYNTFSSNKLSFLERVIISCNTINSPQVRHFNHLLKRTQNSNHEILNSKEKCSLLRPFVERSCSQINLMCVKNLEDIFYPCYIINKNIFEQRRNKSKTTQKRPEYDSESDSDDDVEVIQGTKVMSFNMQSIRLDGFLKKAMSMSRSKVDAAFYEGSIRVNGVKPTKKSHQLQIGDEVDLIRGLSPMNSENLHISRLELISVKENDDDEEEKLRVKVRRSKTLYVENYPDAPWKKVGVSS